MSEAAREQPQVTGGAYLRLIVLGAAIGLTSIPIEEGQLPGWGTLAVYGLFAGISILVSFGLGGYIAGRASRGQDRFTSIIHGVGVWAVVTLAFILLSTRLVSVFGGAFTAAGVSASAGITAGSVLEFANKEMLADALAGRQAF